MANTAALGPTANQAISGVTAFGQPQRLHRTSTGASAAGFSSSPRGHIWTGCFSTEIPTSATINGFEITSETLGSAKGNIGTFGSTGASEDCTFTIMLWNGSTLSSTLPFLNVTVTSNITLANSDTEITFLGGNQRHPALPGSNQGGGQILAGSSSTLGGIAFDPANQADFGFALKVIAHTSTPTYGAIRGLSLKAYYTLPAGYTHEVVGITSTDISSVSGVVTADIDNIIGV